jgi:hypothetical protein
MTLQKKYDLMATINSLNRLICYSLRPLSFPHVLQGEEVWNPKTINIKQVFYKQFSYHDYREKNRQKF